MYVVNVVILKHLPLHYIYSIFYGKKGAIHHQLVLQIVMTSLGSKRTHCQLIVDIHTLVANSNTDLLFHRVAYKRYIVPWSVEHMNLNVAMFTYPLPKIC
jgi:hypothetical protein